MTTTEDTTNYTSTGYDAMNDVQPPTSGSGHWLDFKQGRGDSAIIRLVHIIGTATKDYKGKDQHQVLTMDVEVFERNGASPTDKDGIILPAGTTFRTNPRSSWCLDIKRAVTELATQAGWDGNPSTFTRYAPAHKTVLMRWTRNDNEWRQGHIDVEILGPAPHQPAPPPHQPTPTAPWTPPTTTAVPWGKPKDSAHDMIIALNRAETDQDLTNIMTNGWASLTTKEQQDRVNGAYQRRRDVILGTDVPF